MHSKNAPNYIFSMFEASEDIKLDKRNFDERYGKSYEAVENFEASVSIG